MMCVSASSSVIQIPGESTLRRNFQQIQEGEGRRTPNPLSSRRVAPPPNEPARRDYNHGGPRPRGPPMDEHGGRGHDDRRRVDDRQPHDRGMRHLGDMRQPGDGFQRHNDHANPSHQPRELRESAANHHRPAQPANRNGQPVRPSPPRADNDGRSLLNLPHVCDQQM